MRSFELNYRPYGSHALLLQWPKEIHKEIVEDLLAFKAIISKAFPQYHCTAAYCELMVFSESPIIALPELIKELQSLYPQRNSLKVPKHRIRIPVCYEAPFGLDQMEVCVKLQLTPEELIKLHTNAIYTVYAIGFLPGFMYLGGLAESLYYPRKEIPRTHVPEGAVGIAGWQTGIYPQDSPGGWQLIGSCPIKLFNIKKQPPVIAAVGDEIQFFPIGKSEYEHYQLRESAGIFELEKQLLL